MLRGRAWLWVVVFAGLVIAARVLLRIPLKMPGHAGVVGVAVLVLARAVVPGRFVATLVCALASIAALAIGDGDKGALDTLATLIAPGIAVDAVAWFLPAGAWAYAAQGLAGNVAKWAAKMLLQSLAGIPTGFALLPQAYPLALHALFGVAAGCLAFAILRAHARLRPLSD